MLSISGLRGLIGQSLTPDVAARYAAAIGQWLKSGRRTDGRMPRVVLARDSRPSGQMIELAVASGLTAVGCQVISLGIVTTPGTGIMAGHLEADAGVVVTASHNPIQWNGIKILQHDGVAPPPEEAQQIVERYKNSNVQYVDPQSIESLQHDDSSNQVHIERVLKEVDVAAIQRKKIKVVLDSVHGAGGPVTAALLDALGVELVHLWAEPTGLFPHVPEPTKANLTALCDAVREHNADIGFAQDPDADRLAVVDENGTYIGEEYTLALAAVHLLSTAKQSNPVVVANLSTSRMVDDIAASVGGRAVRSAVGEANVAKLMRENNALIGGEGNGGVIWPKISHVRDSVAGIALMLELLAAREESLSEIVKTVPAYAIVKDKVDIKSGMAERIEPSLREAFADQKFDTQDGVRIDWPNKWVHVRPSNTEPILRLIAEAPTEAEATELVKAAADAMGL